MAVADRLAAGVTAAPDLELLANGLSVVCFRCRPVNWPGDGQALDTLNRQVLSAVQVGGHAFLAGTAINGMFALPACVVNPGSSAGTDHPVLAAARAVLSRLV